MIIEIRENNDQKAKYGENIVDIDRDGGFCNSDHSTGGLDGGNWTYRQSSDGKKIYTIKGCDATTYNYRYIKSN